MLATSQGEQVSAQELQQRERLNALIGEWVLSTLGRPEGLRQVQVRLLWEGHYRVNVLVGADAASARVAHSFFLVADGDGDIVGSTPPLCRLGQQEPPPGRL